MADVVLDANAVGQVVTYVAPGFLARFGYRTRYPGSDRPAGEVLIAAVVISLPFVAAVQALLPGEQKPTQLGYVALLLIPAAVLGYLVALLRGRRRTKRWLARIGYRLEPEGSIYSHTLLCMSDDAPVTIELKDGRLVSGCPRNGPQHKDDGVKELYLVYPEAKADAESEWVPAGQGLIVPLSEVATIMLSEEPTAAPIASPD